MQYKRWSNICGVLTLYFGDETLYYEKVGMSSERMIDMIKVGIIGATGYAGGELVRILSAHKETGCAGRNRVRSRSIRSESLLP